MNILMHFKQVMKTVLFDRATDFNGRSDRPEYWYFSLYGGIIAGLFMLIDNYILGYTFWNWIDPFSETNNSGVLTTSFLLLTLVQSISLGVRRLHDRGHSGWWLLAAFVPILNFTVIYWAVRDAKDTPEALKYKNPYGKRS